MVSFNFESMFTNVSIDAAVASTLQKLVDDPRLSDRMTQTPAQIADLLNFVLRSTYFQFNKLIYEQLEGTAMGSPVSAVIGNLYMESFRQQAITTSSYKSSIWKHYVDDTFTILDRGDLYSLTASEQPASSLPFVSPWKLSENDYKFAFLDTVVSRELDGCLTTGIYRKPMHTSQYLAYNSHHP